jgi:DNA-binding LacI/PurR family transcriptional regulator
MIDEAWIVAGGGLLEDGARALAALMHLPQPPTAVLCYNDMAAIGLLAAAQAAGVHIPDDLSIVGYDNIPFSAFTTPALTTVDQPKQTLGRLAVQTCLAALGDGASNDRLVEGSLVIRSSAGPAA